MKKKLLSSLTLGCVVASMSGVAMAAETSPITMNAKLESRFTLSDSALSNDMHFFNNIARLGVDINSDKVMGRLVVQFSGNNVDYTAANPVTSDPTSQGTVAVREAWVGMNLYNKNNMQVSAEMGRFIPNGATTYGPDAVTGWWAGAGNFTSTDGFAANVNYKKGSMTLSAQAALAVDMPVFALTSEQLDINGSILFNQGDSQFGFSNGYKSNDHIAKIVNVQVQNQLSNDMTMEAALAYGTMDGALQKYEAPDYTYANSTYTEGSLGVHYKNMTAGAWFSNINQGSKKTTTTPYAGTTATASPETEAYRTVGLGGTYDVLANVLSKGDSVSVAGAAQFVMDRSEGTVDRDKDPDMYTASGIYKIGPMTASLNWVFFTAGKEGAFKDSQGTDEKRAQKIYLATSVSL